jgi:hypothetical protein
MEGIFDSFFSQRIIWFLFQNTGGIGTRDMGEKMYFQTSIIIFADFLKVMNPLKSDTKGSWILLLNTDFFKRACAYRLK